MARVKLGAHNDTLVVTRTPLVAAAAPLPQLLALGDMQANPENPRSPEAEVDELADDLRDHGQLHNVNVMTLARFLEEKPHLRDRVDQAVPYVVVNGCLRLSAAPRAGLKALKYEIRDDWTVDDIDECLIGENVHRTALNPMRLARKLAEMLERPKYGGAPGKPGSARKLGEALNKRHPWVPERLSLLKLAPVLQDAVEAERIPFHLARHCSRLHPDVQAGLAAGKLPEDVARAWLIKLKLDQTEQLRRWEAGEPFDVTPVQAADEEESPATPPAARPKPVFSFRLMERSEVAVREFGAKLRDELTEDERAALVEELTAST